MSPQKIISKYTRYNYWANEQMTTWLQTLDTNLLYKETLSSFASIDLTLQHMLHAQNFWFAVITEAAVKRPDKTIQINAVHAVMNNLLTASRQMADTCKTYTEAALLKQVPSDNMIQSRYEFILHVVNHNAYHRGQIVTMSRLLGVVKNIPEIDYETFLWGGH